MNSDVMKRENSKNYGIELLRIVSMLFIVVLHVIGQGGIAGASQQLSLQYNTANTMLAFCYCAVNIYALISGYVGCKSKFKLSRLVNLWLQVISINAMVFVSAALYNREWVSLQNLYDIFFPISKNQYWYFTAFIGLMVIMPFLNAGINNLSKKQYSFMLLGMLVLFSILPIESKNDLFYTHSGYSLLWLAFMYITGGYFKLHFDMEKKIPLFKTTCFLIYVTSASLLTYIKLYKELKLINEQNGYTYFNNYYSYTSVFVVVCSVTLFLLFAKINIDNILLTRLIGFFSGSTFGVYIIHTNIIIWKFVLSNRFVEWTLFSWYKMAIYIVIMALAIFVVCAVVDKIRALVFKLLFIEKITGFADKFIK